MLCEQAELEAERKKTHWVYQSFLPSATADLILAGHKPEAGIYYLNILCHLLNYTIQ